jgi:hypothetical protein
MGWKEKEEGASGRAGGYPFFVSFVGRSKQFSENL